MAAPVTAVTMRWQGTLFRLPIGATLVCFSVTTFIMKYIMKCFCFLCCSVITRFYCIRTNPNRTAISVNVDTLSSHFWDLDLWMQLMDDSVRNQEKPQVCTNSSIPQPTKSNSMKWKYWSMPRAVQWVLVRSAIISSNSYSCTISSLDIQLDVHLTITLHSHE